jgi:effector-binding domain-containing protein
MKTWLPIILILIIVLFAFFLYYGGFKKIEFKIDTNGGHTLLYEEVIGEYKQSGEVMDRIYSKLLEHENIETFKGCGIYYDNPQKVEKSRLRSDIGCILEVVDSTTLVELSSRYKIKTIPEKEYIITEFPYKGSFSVFFSIMKVYPALNKFIEENGYNNEGPVIEIYDVPNKKILYLKEV